MDYNLENYLRGLINMHLIFEKIAVWGAESKRKARQWAIKNPEKSFINRNLRDPLTKSLDTRYKHRNPEVSTSKSRQGQVSSHFDQYFTDSVQTRKTPEMFNEKYKAIIDSDPKKLSPNELKSFDAYANRDLASKEFRSKNPTDLESVRWRQRRVSRNRKNFFVGKSKFGVGAKLGIGALGAGGAAYALHKYKNRDK